MRPDLRGSVRRCRETSEMIWEGKGSSQRSLGGLWKDPLRDPKNLSGLLPHSPIPVAPLTFSELWGCLANCSSKRRAKSGTGAVRNKSEKLAKKGYPLPIETFGGPSTPRPFEGFQISRTPKPLHLNPTSHNGVFQRAVSSRRRFPCLDGAFPCLEAFEGALQIDFSSENSLRNPIVRCTPLRCPPLGPPEDVALFQRKKQE